MEQLLRCNDTQQLDMVKRVVGNDLFQQVQSKLEQQQRQQQHLQHQQQFSLHQYQGTNRPAKLISLVFFPIYSIIKVVILTIFLFFVRPIFNVKKKL